MQCRPQNPSLPASLLLLPRSSPRTTSSHLSILIARDSVAVGRLEAAAAAARARAVNKWPISVPEAVCGSRRAAPSSIDLVLTSSLHPCQKVRFARSQHGSRSSQRGRNSIPFREVLEEGQNAVILKLASASLVNLVQPGRLRRSLCTRKTY